MSKTLDFTKGDVAAQPVRTFRALENPVPKDAITSTKYKVIMPYFDWMQWSTYVKKAPGEISVLGYVDIIDRTTFFVTGFYMPKQKNTGTSTDMDEDDLAKYFTLEQEAGRDTSKKRNWTHSHATMAPFWSGTDENCIKTLGRSWENYVLSLVTNKRNEYKARLDVFDPVQISFDNIPLELVMDDRGLPTAEQIAVWEREVEEKSRPLYPTYGFGWDGNGGGVQVHSGFQGKIWDSEQRIWREKTEEEKEREAIQAGSGGTGDGGKVHSLPASRALETHTPGGFPGAGGSPAFDRSVGQALREFHMAKLGGHYKNVSFLSAADAEAFVDDATAALSFLEQNRDMIREMISDEEMNSMTLEEVFQMLAFQATYMQNELEREETGQENLFEDDPRHLAARGNGISGASMDFTAQGNGSLNFTYPNGKVQPMPAEVGEFQDGIYD